MRTLVELVFMPVVECVPASAPSSMMCRLGLCKDRSDYAVEIAVKTWNCGICRVCNKLSNICAIRAARKQADSVPIFVKAGLIPYQKPHLGETRSRSTHTKTYTSDHHTINSSRLYSQYTYRKGIASLNGTSDMDIAGPMHRSSSSRRLKSQKHSLPWTYCQHVCLLNIKVLDLSHHLIEKHRHRCSSKLRITRATTSSTAIQKSSEIAFLLGFVQEVR